MPDLPSPPVQVVKRFVRNLDENLEAGNGLWLHGDVGTGKTTLAMIVSKAALDSGRTVAVYSLPLLLAAIRDTYDDPHRGSYLDFIDQLAEVDLLHIDDCAAAKNSAWVLEQLYTIINSRYEEERSLIITSNVERVQVQTIEDAKPVLDENATPRDVLAAQITERTVSRIEQMCMLIHLHGEDARRFVA